MRLRFSSSKAARAWPRWPGIEADRGAECALGRFEIARSGFGEAELGLDGWIVGIDLRGFAHHRLARLGPIGAGEHVGKVDHHLDDVGSKRDRPLKGFDGAVGIARSGEHIAEIVPAFEIFGSRRQHRAIGGSRLAGPALLLVHPGRDPREPGIAAALRADRSRFVERPGRDEGGGEIDSHRCVAGIAASARRK